MRILMLDKNWLIDRRIALMIDTLRVRGHEFKILHVQPPPGRWERTDMTVDTIALPLEPTGQVELGDGMFPRPPHVREVLRPGSVDLRRRRKTGPIRDENDLAKSGLGGKVTHYLRDPETALDILRRNAFPFYWKYPAMAAFSLLRLPGRLLELAPGEDDELNHRVYSPAGVPLDHWDKLAVRFADRHWRPEIVCANDYPALRAAIEMKKRFGCRVIFDAHELYSYQPGVPHLAAKSIFREERVLLSRVDGLILINEQHKAIVDRDSPFKGPVALCANATKPPDGFDITRRYDWIRRKVAIPADHRIMLFQGGINTGRRVDFLLRGLAQARNRKVHQVFLTFGAEIEEFRAMAKDLGIEGRVHFLPFVPWEEVIFWAASADCGIMPYQATDQNTAISSPNKMYEFITAGTPMIGSSNLANVHAIVHGEGFGVTVPLRTDQDYANAIDMMFDERLGGAERFRPALIEKAHRYHWDSQIMDVIRLYDHVCAKAGSSKAESGFSSQRAPHA